MKVFSSLVFFYLKQMLTSILYLGTLAFMGTMLITRFFINQNEDFDYMDYGNFLGEMMLIVQAVMLLFTVFFYRLLSNEFRFGASNLFIGSFRVTLIKIGALLFNHLLIVGVFIGFEILTVFAFYQLWDIPFSVFYWQSAGYIGLYWYLPLIFACLVGILTAILFGKNKFSFVFIIVSWLAIGPMNTELFGQYFRELSFRDGGSLFYIGPINSESPYNELIGYNISIEALGKLVFWISTIAALILLFLLKSTRTARDKLLVLGVAALLVFGNVWIVPGTLAGGKPVFDFVRSERENAYYQGRDQEIAPNTLLYEIENYEISLVTEEIPRVTVEVGLSDVESDTLSFVLYHHFDVQKVTDAQDEEVDFVQRGDVIEVNAPESETVTGLTFRYAMQDSVAIPVSSDYLYLPNYMSWLPTKAAHPPFRLDEVDGQGLRVNAVQSHERISYELEYTGDVPFYTDLPKIKEGMYKGDVAGGITVLGGMMTWQQFGEREVIYPNAWSDISAEWPVYEQTLMAVNEKLTRMFGIEAMELPNQIFLVAPHHERSSYQSSDHLLFQHGTLLNIRSAVKEVPEVYVTALLWGYDQRTFASYEQIEAFNQILAYFIRDEVGIKSPVDAPTTAMPPFVMFDRYDAATQQTITNFYKEFYGLSIEQQEAFLVLWYQKMEEVSDSWTKASELLQQFKGEVG